MTDTASHTPDEPSADAPFGAGIPAEPVESIRLSPGQVRGPTLEVRGRSRAHAGAQPAETSAQSAAPQSPRIAQDSAAPSFATAPAADPSAAAASTSSAASEVPPGPPPQSPPQQGSPPNGPSTPGTPPTAANARPPRRWWTALAHLAFLIPFPPGVVITAVLWIWRRDRDALMADQGREALNMQLTFWLAIGLLGVTCIGEPLIPFVYVLGAVLCILAAIAAGNGDRHRYPWVFRFLV